MVGGHRNEIRPESALDSSIPEIDSAGSTLIASGSTTLDAGKSYADAELEAFDERERIRKRGESWSEERMGRHVEEDKDEEESEEDRDIEDEEEGLLAAAADGAPPVPKKRDDRKTYVPWNALPHKSQLAILALARLSEPLSQLSLQSYMFYMLKSFPAADGSTLSDSTVAAQTGLLAAAFTGAQFMTAVMWGRLADSRMGRKKVILIGMLGTVIGTVGFGFSESFAVAVFFRFMGGALNGNVGVMKTMISEVVKEKKYQSKAFLLLPMMFNIGVIIGPLLGGILADPVTSYPGMFGPGGALGGKDGNAVFSRWRYALPNLVNACFVGMMALMVFFGLEETSEALKHKPDVGLRVTRWIAHSVFRRRPQQEYEALARDEGDVELNGGKRAKPQTRGKLPFRRIWTRNVITTLVANAFLTMHVGSFNNMWFIFLSTPRYNPDEAHQTLPLPDGYTPHLPFTFTGGLALPPRSIGGALAILGAIGISLQVLIYPYLSFRLGTIRAYRLSLLFFPFTYLLAPFLTLMPSTKAPPAPASGPAVWLYLTFVLTVQLMGRTFALPSAAILNNNASPHPSVLGTVHGIAQSVSSAARCIGPILGSTLYGIGLNAGMVGLSWWCMAGVAVLGSIAACWVWEGDGHEIWLPEDGEREDEDEYKT